MTTTPYLHNRSVKQTAVQLLKSYEYKGSIYFTLDLVENKENDTMGVLYRSEKGFMYWRSIEDFETKFNRLK